MKAVCLENCVCRKQARVAPKLPTCERVTWLPKVEVLSGYILYVLKWICAMGAIELVLKTEDKKMCSALTEGRL